MAEGLKVSVTRLYKLGSQKALKAFANIEIQNNGMLVAIDGVKVFDKEEGQGPWIVMPQTSFVSKKGKNIGESVWNDIITLDQTTEYAIRDAVTDAYQNPDFTGAKSNKPLKKSNARVVSIKETPEEKFAHTSASEQGSDEDIPF